MLKRMLSLVLACAIVFSLCLPVFALEHQNHDNMTLVFGSSDSVSDILGGASEVMRIQNSENGVDYS